MTFADVVPCPVLVLGSLSIAAFGFFRDLYTNIFSSLQNQDSQTIRPTTTRKSRIDEQILNHLPYSSWSLRFVKSQKVAFPAQEVAGGGTGGMLAPFVPDEA